MSPAEINAMLYKISEVRRNERLDVLIRFRKLSEILRDKAVQNEGTDAELAFEAAASSVDRVCDEVFMEG